MSIKYTVKIMTTVTNLSRVSKSVRIALLYKLNSSGEKTQTCFTFLCIFCIYRQCFARLIILGGELLHVIDIRGDLQYMNIFQEHAISWAKFNCTVKEKGRNN